MRLVHASGRFNLEWFIGMARALGKMIGNCVAAVVIGAWEKDLDVALARSVLSGESVVDIAVIDAPALAAE